MPTPLLTPPPPLNLPAAQLSLRPASKGVEVLDVLRQRWLLLTPEEWVRQHFVHYLIDTLGYPGAMMANEVGITLNSTSRRCDTVVYARDLTPLMIIEYKAPSVRIDRRVFDQIVRYNIVLQVPYLVVSNGMEHYCFRVERASGKCTLLQGVPSYESLIPEP